jgi:4-hydroxy-3-methylbut-2-enyl diphosphate reductase
MKSFNVPTSYRSELISQLKLKRQAQDPKRKDSSPTSINLGAVEFLLARHFGFCYGVENAIDIAYRAVEENPGKNIFLLSEMIHNPEVNQDLLNRGVRFLMSPDGATLIPIASLNSDDIVIVPAFGTTIELQNQLQAQGINPKFYDTTCPFVEKVWKRSRDLVARGFTIIIHGKPNHEETRATFSQTLGNQSQSQTTSGTEVPRLVVTDKVETQLLVDFMVGKKTLEEFWKVFRSQCSPNFDPTKDLSRLGVVNQTTMLASETHEISSMLKKALEVLHGAENIEEHFGDTRDTLCYATYENQTATQALLDRKADLAVVVGGYNSSNTSHLVELCQEVMPTFFVINETEIISDREIRHFSLDEKLVIVTKDWLPANRPITVAITSGASCPDALVEGVMRRIASLCGVSFDSYYAN